MPGPGSPFHCNMMRSEPIRPALAWPCLSFQQRRDCGIVSAPPRPAVPPKDGMAGAAEVATLEGSSSLYATQRTIINLIMPCEQIKLCCRATNPSLAQHSTRLVLSFRSAKEIKIMPFLHRTAWKGWRIDSGESERGRGGAGASGAGTLPGHLVPDRSPRSRVAPRGERDARRGGGAHTCCDTRRICEHNSRPSVTSPFGS